MASVKSQLQGGIDTALQVMRFSDRIADMEARLTLMVDDGGSVQELENKMYASAQAARQMTSDGAGMLAANVPLLAEGIGAQIQGAPGGMEECKTRGGSSVFKDGLAQWRIREGIPLWRPCLCTLSGGKNMMG